MEDLIFLKNATWQEVFEEWKNREANDPGWINCAVNIKGWPDWASWRSYTAALLGAEKREWKIYKILEPQKFIPKMLVGPYGGWQKRLPEKNILSFSQMLEITQNYEELSENDKVSSMINNFPVGTQFIGLVCSDNKKIVCLEGHHRATAVALAVKNGQALNLGEENTIALCELAMGEEKLLDEVLEKGTNRPN